LILVNSSPGKIDFTCEKAEDPRIRNKQAIKLILTFISIFLSANQKY
jgi:hypothetical protein